MSKETKQVYAILIFAWIVTIALVVCMNYKTTEAVLGEVNALTEQVDAIEQKVAEIGKESVIDISNVSCVMPIGEYTLTFYCPCEKCCGKSTGITASGTKATEGKTCAAEGLPIGSVIYIEALGEFRVVEDRFGDPSKTGKIDIFVDDHDAALQLGVMKSQIYLVSEGD